MTKPEKPPKPPKHKLTDEERKVIDARTDPEPTPYAGSYRLALGVAERWPTVRLYSDRDAGSPVERDTTIAILEHALRVIRGYPAPS